jgi:hypothetical protein
LLQDQLRRSKLEALFLTKPHKSVKIQQNGTGLLRRPDLSTTGLEKISVGTKNTAKKIFQEIYSFSTNNQKSKRLPNIFITIFMRAPKQKNEDSTKLEQNP